MSEFDEVYNRQLNTVLRTCVLYLKNVHDAEEATQDTFIKYLRYNPQFESVEHEKAWLIRTASNICKNVIKSSWFKKMICSDDLSHFYTENEEFNILQDILELPPKYKMPIYLFYYEGYSTEEIGKILDINPSTVRSHLSRGRNLLKITLGSDDINE